MADKKKQPKFAEVVFPVGVANKAYNLTVPDEYQGKSEYKMRFTLDDTEENRAALDGFITKARDEAKKHGIKLKKNHKIPFLYPEDHDEDDFTIQEGKKYAKYDETCVGKIIIEMKTKFKPGQIDTARETLPEGIKIFSGDVVRPKCELVPYEGLGSGFSLRLKVVQLVEKNSSFSGGGVNTDGFDEIDGYVADNGFESDDDEAF